MAYPSRYTPTVVRAITKSLASGNPLRMTLSELGISRDTHWRWLKIYPEYAAKIERARAKAEKKMLGLIKDAAPKDWRAALALLQCSIRPGHYGRVQPDVYDLPPGEMATLSISEYQKRMRQIFGVDSHAHCGDTGNPGANQRQRRGRTGSQRNAVKRPLGRFGYLHRREHLKARGGLAGAFKGHSSGCSDFWLIP